MIKQITPISMAEISEFVDKENGEQILLFVNRFNTLKVGEARELKKRLAELEIIKIKDEQIVKIVDLLPETSEEVNKIVIDSNLDEDEIKKILDTVKEYK